MVFFQVSQYYIGIFSSQFFCNGLFDVIVVVGDEGYLVGKGLFWWLLFQFIFFKQLVFDIEGFLMGQCGVGGNCFCFLYYIDGIDVEFVGYLGSLFVFGKSKYIYVWIKNDDWVGVVYCRVVGVFVVFVVFSVVFLVLFECWFQLCFDCFWVVEVGIGRYFQYQWFDFGMQEVIGVGGVQWCQFVQVMVVDELQYLFIICEVFDYMFMVGVQFLQDGCYFCGLFFLFGIRQVFYMGIVKYWVVFVFVFGDVVGGLFNNFQVVYVVFVGGVFLGE